MTNQMTAHGATTRSSHDTALRATGLFGLVGGAAWVIDSVTIAVLNRSFDPLDSVLFIVGLVGLVLTIGALAVHLSAGRKGPARAGVAVGAFLATTAVLATVSFAADTLGRHAFSSSNIGLHEEWSCFSTGLVLVAMALRRYRREGAAVLSHKRCWATLTTCPSGLRTKKRRIPHGSLVIG